MGAPPSSISQKVDSKKKKKKTEAKHKPAFAILATAAYWVFSGRMISC
jgi:hypothetical protein